MSKNSVREAKLRIQIERSIKCVQHFKRLQETFAQSQWRMLNVSLEGVCISYTLATTYSITTLKCINWKFISRDIRTRFRLNKAYVLTLHSCVALVYVYVVGQNKIQTSFKLEL